MAYAHADGIKEGHEQGHAMMLLSFNAAALSFLNAFTKAEGQPVVT